MAAKVEAKKGPVAGAFSYCRYWPLLAVLSAFIRTVEQHALQQLISN